MSRFLVFSDVHGDKLSLLKLKQIANECDGVIFAGDGYSALKDFTDKPVFAVGGNCDLSGAPEIVTEIEGAKILLTHGHRYGVKSSLLSLTLRARELECTVAIFGHTHQPFCSIENGVFMLNPGASSGHVRTYAILTVENGVAQADVTKLY